MKNIFLIPTDKPSRLYINLLDYLSFDSLQLRGSNQNIYITNSEEIKEGDWCIVTPFGVDKFAKVVRFKKENGTLYNLECKKIILTTDADLIKDNIQAIEDGFVEWFVKNPSCESIEVAKTNKLIDNYADKDEDKWEVKYHIYLPKEEPKQELDCPFDFTSRCTMGRCDCKPKQETLEEREWLPIFNEYVKDNECNLYTFFNWLETNYNLPTKK